MNTTCPERIYTNSWGGHVCGKNARHEHEGVMFCKTHHPPTVKAKRDAKAAEWSAKVDRRIAANRENDAKAAEQKRRADCFPDLLEALQSIAECCDEDRAARDYSSRQTEIRGIARAAIKKATGEQQ